MLSLSDGQAVQMHSVDRDDMVGARGNQAWDRCRALPLGSRSMIGVATFEAVCTLTDIAGRPNGASTAFCCRFLLSMTGAERILTRYLMPIVAGDPGRPVLPFSGRRWLWIRFLVHQMDFYRR
jgi:hypothetical protein